MSVIITMAGMGSRFASQGYTVPKYEIIARNKSLFEWSLLSLREFFSQRIIFACLDSHNKDFIIQKAINLGIKDYDIVSRKSLSAGQAETAYDCINMIDKNEPLWIYNIDTYVESGFTPSDMDNYDGCIYTFTSHSPSMSYVRCNQNREVLEVAEKKVISHDATVGMYGFKSAELYSQAYASSYISHQSLEVQGERYIAPMYSTLLLQNNKIIAPALDDQLVHILGTPSEVQQFDPSVMPPFGNLTN